MKTLADFSSSSIRYKLLGETHYEGRLLYTRCIEALTLAICIPFALVMFVLIFIPPSSYSIATWVTSVYNRFITVPITGPIGAFCLVAILLLLLEWGRRHPGLYNVLPYSAGDDRNLYFLPLILATMRSIVFIALVSIVFTLFISRANWIPLGAESVALQRGVTLLGIPLIAILLIVFFQQRSRLKKRITAQTHSQD